MATGKSKMKQASASSIADDASSSSTGRTRSLLETQKIKWEELNQKEDMYKRKVDNHLRKLISSRTYLEAELLRKGEKIEDLQKALVELQVSFFEQQEKNWSLASEAEKLKDKEAKLHESVREILKLTKDKELHDRIIYILKEPHVEIGHRAVLSDDLQIKSREQNRAEAIKRLKQDLFQPSSQDSPRASLYKSPFEENAVVRMLKEEIQSLQSQLNECRKISLCKKDVNEDCKASLESAKWEIIETTKENQSLRLRLQESERLFMECDNELRKLKDYIRKQDEQHKNELDRMAEFIKRTDQEHGDEVERMKDHLLQEDYEHEKQLEKMKEHLKERDKVHEEEINSRILELKKTTTVPKTAVTTDSAQTDEDYYSRKAIPKTSSHSVQTNGRRVLSSHSVQTMQDLSTRSAQTIEDLSTSSSQTIQDLSTHSAQTILQDLNTHSAQTIQDFSTHSVQTVDAPKIGIKTHSVQTLDAPKISVETHSVQTVDAPKISVKTHSVQTTSNAPYSIQTVSQQAATKPRSILKVIYPNNSTLSKLSQSHDEEASALTLDTQNMSELLGLLSTAISKSSMSLQSICSTEVFCKALDEQPAPSARSTASHYISDTDVSQLLSNARVCTRLSFDIDNAAKHLSCKMSSLTIGSKENAPFAVEGTHEVKQLTSLTRELTLKSSEVDVCSLNLSRASFFDYLKGSRPAFVKFGVREVQQRIKFASNVKEMASTVESMSYMIPRAIALTQSIFKKSATVMDSTVAKTKMLRPKSPAVLSVHEPYTIEDLAETKTKSVIFDIDDDPAQASGSQYVTEPDKHSIKSVRQHRGKESAEISYRTDKRQRTDVKKRDLQKYPSTSKKPSESRVDSSEINSIPGLSGKSIANSSREDGVAKTKSSSVSMTDSKEAVASNVSRSSRLIADVASQRPVPGHRQYQSVGGMFGRPDKSETVSSLEKQYFSEESSLGHPVSSARASLEKQIYNSDINLLDLSKSKSANKKPYLGSDVNLGKNSSSYKMTSSSEEGSIEYRYARLPSTSKATSKEDSSERSSIEYLYPISQSETTMRPSSSSHTSIEYRYPIVDVELKGRLESSQTNVKKASLGDQYLNVKEKIMENLGLREKISVETTPKMVESRSETAISGIDKALVKLKHMESDVYFKEDQICKELEVKIDSLKDKVKELRGDISAQNLHDQFEEYSALTLSKLEALANVSKNSLEAAESQIAIHKANAKQLSEKLRETEELLRESVSECLRLKQCLQEEEMKREIDRETLICDLKESLETVSDFNDLETAVKEVVTAVDKPKREFSTTRTKPCTSDFFSVEGHTASQEKIRDMRCETRKLTTEIKLLRQEMKKVKDLSKTYKEESEAARKEQVTERENLKGTLETLTVKNTSLLEQIRVAKDRLKNMERFRKLEIEGFHTDVKNLKSKIKDLEKQLVKAVLIFEKDQKDMELLKTVHETALRSKQTASSIKRLKAKLYELETDIRNL